MTTAAVEARRAPARGLRGFNILTGIVLGVAGFYLGWWLGHQIHAKSIEYFADTNQNDVALMLGYLFFVIGFVVGLGFAKYPLSRMLGREPSHRENEEGGIGRYFGLCTDHKVVGMQYLVGIGVFFFIGGLNAMLIRAELLRPSPQLFGAGNYLTIVGLHGAMMMGVMTSGDPRAVRQLLRPADDRREADGLPADRGAHLLAPDGGRRDLRLDDLLRRLPDRLDGLRAAQRPGELRLRLLHLLLRAGRPLDDPARAQPDRHDRRPCGRPG